VPATPREVVETYFGELAKRDAQAASAHLDPEVVEEITSVGVLRGADEVRDFFAGLFAAVPDLELTIDRIVADGDWVAVSWRMAGRFTGGPLFNGVQATGGDMRLRGCDMIEVRDGRIVRNNAYQDGMELARALGMMPPQDSAAEKAMISAFNGATKLRTVVRERFA
jgi:ketosteroid isomerase-like protein